MMIAFFTVVTVILPALVLAGIVAFAVHDFRAEHEVQGPKPLVRSPSFLLRRAYEGQVAGHSQHPSALRSSKFQVPSSKLADHSRLPNPAS